MHLDTEYNVKLNWYLNGFDTIMHFSISIDWYGLNVRQIFCSYLEMDNRPKTVSYWLNLFQRNPFFFLLIVQYFTIHNFSVHTQFTLCFTTCQVNHRISKIFFNYKTLKFRRFSFQLTISNSQHTHRSYMNKFLCLIFLHFLNKHIF